MVCSGTYARTVAPTTVMFDISHIMALGLQHVQVVGCQLLVIGLVVSIMIYIGQP